MKGQRKWTEWIKERKEQGICWTQFVEAGSPPIHVINVKVKYEKKKKKKVVWNNKRGGNRKEKKKKNRRKKKREKNKNKKQ